MLRTNTLTQMNILVLFRQTKIESIYDLGKKKQLLTFLTLCVLDI